MVEANSEEGSEDDFQHDFAVPVVPSGRGRGRGRGRGGGGLVRRSVVLSRHEVGEPEVMQFTAEQRLVIDEVYLLPLSFSPAHPFALLPSPPWARL